MTRGGRLTAALLALALGIAALGAAPVRADVGTAGSLYTGKGGTATAPTGEKPQAKTWFHDGAWWAVMYNTATGSFEIYKRIDGAWSTTGTVVDARDGSCQVYVTHSTTDQSTWVTPYVMPVGNPANVSADDISSIVSFNGHIGVMWSYQAPNGTGVPDEFYWATHIDGQPDDAWQVQPAFGGIEMADDHINLKAIDGDPAGQVFAAVKTSLNRAADPQIMLLWLDDWGAWHSTTVLRVSDGTPTRAQVAIDKGSRDLYVFASEGPCCTGGAIYMKETSLDSIAFPTGPGIPLIESSTGPKINNVDTPKEPVDSTSGLPILASDDSTHRYWHTFIPLDGTDVTPPETRILTGPTGTTASTSAQLSFSGDEPGSTFECSLDGAAFTACDSPITFDGLAAVLAVPTT